MKIYYCIDCGKEISSRGNSKRCFSCAAKKRMKIVDFSGENNPNFKHGESLKQNYCIDCNKEIDYSAWRRTKKCSFCSIAYNKILTKEFLYQEYIINKKTQKQIAKEIGCSDSPISSRLKKYNIKTRPQGSTTKGRNNPMFGKIAKHGKRIYYKEIYMRSTWEVKYAKYLDENQIKWLYESKTFDLGNTTYTPDFYLPEQDVWIEIKGYWRDDAKEKFRLFRKEYPKINIQLLMKKELKDMGVINV